jgi:hypothetical protein
VAVRRRLSLPALAALLVAALALAWATVAFFTTGLECEPAECGAAREWLGTVAGGIVALAAAAAAVYTAWWIERRLERE